MELCKASARREYEGALFVEEVGAVGHFAVCEAVGSVGCVDAACERGEGDAR